MALNACDWRMCAGQWESCLAVIEERATPTARIVCRSCNLRETRRRMARISRTIEVRKMAADALGPAVPAN